MNGRVYDPQLGRFLSADPFVQLPANSQSYNRYSYALNNPLKYTDPSGYFFGKVFKAVRKLVRKAAKAIFSIVKPAYNFLAQNELAYAIAQIAVTFVAPGYGNALLAAGTTYAATGDGWAALKAAAISYGSSLAFRQLGGMDWGFAKIIAHGVVGGVVSELSGGRFKDGFIGAAVVQAFAPAIGRIGGGTAAYKPHRVVAAAVLGGTAAALGGGKFANGAVSAAFVSLFGQAAANSNSQQQARTLTVSDIQPGDVLLTNDGSLAKVLSGFGEYGHGGVVLSVNGDVVTVLSADGRGFYIEPNSDTSVGGRSWDVFRVSGIDTVRLGTFANNLPVGGGLSQYLGNSGGNVCSSTVARAIEFSGGPSASRLFGNLVTPNELARTYGPSIGHLQMPLIGGSP